MIQSNSLIGDVTRLAWNRVTKKYPKKLYTCEWYEYILDNCLKLSSKDGKKNYRDALSTYQKLCVDFQILPILKISELRSQVSQYFGHNF